MGAMAVLGVVAHAGDTVLIVQGAAPAEVVMQRVIRDAILDAIQAVMDSVLQHAILRAVDSVMGRVLEM